MDTGSYQKNRHNVDQEVFRLISPEITSGSTSISLILSGSVTSSASGETNFWIDTSSIKNTDYVLWGVGIKHEYEGSMRYRDTLHSCTEVWIPLLDPTGSVHNLKFKVGFRTSYSGSTYLWNTGSIEEDDAVVIPGSWVADGIRIADSDPYTDYGDRQELDYSCTLPQAGQSVLFVHYVPENFEYCGDYNALLNNATALSQEQFYNYSGSVRNKKYVVDDHRSPYIGGFSTGEVPVSGGWERKIDKRINYLSSFSASAVASGYVDPESGETGSLILQTLDLAFLNFRAVSASVYVDREEYKVLEKIEDVWSDLQENNTDDSEVVYFAPLCELIKDEDSVPYPNPNWVFGEIQQVGAKTTIPALGNILFKVNGHTPVRHVRATVFVPFINTVYRTDDYGIIKELYSGSIETGE